MVMNTKYSSMHLGNTKTAVRKTPDDDIEQMGTQYGTLQHVRVLNKSPQIF